MCITRAEFEQSEKDAAKADRFDELQGNYRTCDAERHEARGEAKADGRRADKCLAARMKDAEERGKLEKDRDDKSRQRWIFGAGGFVAGLLVALGLASAF